jgi:hypothetical protein
MVDNSLSLIGDLTIAAGDVTFASGTLSIGGSLDASGGTFDNASGTVLFNSSDTGEIVDPAGSDFYSVAFAAPGGGWTFLSNATATNNFSITSGSSFTAGANTLTVEGVFTNTLGGAATDWTGSTLRLIGGIPYSINTKVSSGDQYAAMIVGPDTDLRMWNSSAASVDVATTSSLYSQDHAAANGALSIYGDFQIGSGIEYWNYANDFDGTVLSGGSRRAVTVSLADNASTTISGGTLQMIGAAGATTTVESGGSGGYQFFVSSGTYSAQYYAFRDMSSSGLQLQGTSTVTSLSNGDFEVSVNGGIAITLARQTLNANAGLSISDTRFEVVAPAAFGFNVSLSATSSNAWTFTDSTGDLTGEDFDIDGTGDCGSIRWDDSSCLLVEQTHYRWRNDDGGLGAPASEWFDTDWDKRKRVRVDNSDNTIYTDAVVKLTVTYDTDMQADFDDLRFTDDSGTIEIPYWIERYTASTQAIVWVEVPSLPANDTGTVFMYYANAGATTTSSSTAVFPLVDDFEDGDIAEYSGDTGLFTVSGVTVYGGSQGLDNTSNESQRATDGIYRTDVSVSQGEIIRYMQYVDTTAGSGDEVCTMFGVQAPGSDNNNYGVCLEQFGTDRISLVRDVESTDTYGGVTILATSTVSFSTGWYEIEIDWQTNDVIDVTLFNSSGSVVATTSATDGTYTTGGYGFTYWFNNGAWDSFTSRPRVASAPTVYFGAEQVDGGASWAGVQDTAGSGYEEGDVARVRIGIENTGLTITNQLFELQFAPKGSAPSCEAVDAGDYSTVPPQASCGTSGICMVTSPNVTNGADTTDLLFGTNGNYMTGKFIESPSNETTALTVLQNEYTELEYAVTMTVNATDESYCFRVTNDGDELDGYAGIPELTLQFDPTISALSLNGGLDISLAPGSTTTIYATGTVSDLNGYHDLVAATSTIFRSGVGIGCSADDNNCYVSGAPLCSFTNCSGNSCDIECTADMYYFADPTDIGTFAGETWRAYLEISDSGGATASATAPSIDLLTLRAINVDQTIDYGTLSVNSNTGSYNASTTVENIGNDNLDLSIAGTDLTDGGSSQIPVSEQIFATTTFDYSSCVFCSTLATSTTNVAVDLPKPTSPTPPILDEVYWGINVPFGIAGTAHQGTNIFYAIGD